MSAVKHRVMKVSKGPLWAAIVSGLVLLDGCVYFPPPSYYRPAYGSRYLDEEPRFYQRRPPPSPRVMHDDDIPEPPVRGPADEEPMKKPKDNPPADLPQTPKEKPSAPPAPKEDKSEVLTATKTSRPGRVKSPYPPYRELDVTGLPSGSLAKDPTSGKVFRVP